jgi:hypothetical protein
MKERKSFDDWLAGARQYGEKGKKKMLVNLGAGALVLSAKRRRCWDHLIGHEVGTEMEVWQQFVVHPRDEHGDGVSDYMIEVLTKKGDSWTQVIAKRNYGRRNL